MDTHPVVKELAQEFNRGLSTICSSSWHIDIIHKEYCMAPFWRPKSSTPLLLQLALHEELCAQAHSKLSCCSICIVTASSRRVTPAVGIKVADALLLHTALHCMHQHVGHRYTTSYGDVHPIGAGWPHAGIAMKGK